MDVRQLLVHLALVGTCVAMSYEGFRAYSVGPFDTHAQIADLKGFVSRLAKSRKVQVLEESVRVGARVGVLVAPDVDAIVKDMLEAAGVAFRLVDDNVQRRLDEAMAVNERRRDQFSGRPDQYYMTFHEQVKVLQELAERYESAHFLSFGRSFQNRHLPLLTINEDRADLPGVWLDAGIHAREWISHATLLYIADRILSGKGEKAKDLRTNYRIYIAPNINPDGYNYTWTEDRYWRKNRNTDLDSDCPGVDLNRNFDANFAYCGTEADHCSEVYPGPSAASEVETQALVNVIMGIQSRGGLRVYINIHAYGQFWLIPWSGSYTKPADYTDLEHVANEAVAAIKARHGSEFTAGTPPDVLYCAAGGAIDWVKNNGSLPGSGAGVKYAYTPELRPPFECCEGDELAGFNPDPSQILPSGEEMFDGIYAAIKATK